VTGRRARTLRLTATAVAGWTLVATGAGHAALVVVGATGEPQAGERAARAAMQPVTVTVAGLDRSLWQLFTGFSLAMALLLVGFGAVTLVVLREGPHLVQRTRALLWLDAAVVLLLLGVSAALLPPPPIVLLGLAAAAIGTALSRPNSTPAPGAA
jgi:hypothetical protein